MQRVHPALVDLAGSWLQQRTAQVVAEGQRSDKMLLRNMVFQGTVLGPTLWNLFHKDARRAFHEAGFVEIVYADDLNGFREFEHNASVDLVMPEAQKCQTELHKWGKANQVSFDPAKESVHIMSHAQPHGDSCELLGITFDCKVRMDLCVRETVSQASWKLTTILRTRRYHEVTRLVQEYKSKILSFVESRTPAPRGQNHTGWNRCDSEALPSRVQSHRRRRARVLQPGSAGNTTRCCNAGPDSPDTLHTPHSTPHTSTDTMWSQSTRKPKRSSPGTYETGVQVVVFSTFDSINLRGKEEMQSHTHLIIC